MRDYALVIAIFVVLVVLVLVLRDTFWGRKYVVPENNSFLEPLQFGEWKRGDVFHAEMEKLSGGLVDHAQMFLIVDCLEEKGLIRRRFHKGVICPYGDGEVLLRGYEYTLTPTGQLRKEWAQSVSKSSTGQASAA